MDARLKTIETGTDIDMPTAEALAFGALLGEGHHVRLSGQVARARTPAV
jgi:2-oxoglutarate dehydrogenase E1 component